MFEATLRKVGDQYVVVVPDEEVARLGLRDGQFLVVEVRPLSREPELRQEVREAFEGSWQNYEAVYRHLADR